MSSKENAGSKGPRWFIIIPGVFMILGLGGYLLFTQFILKPIESEEKRAYQLSRENRKLSKEYEERQSILMQVVKAQRARYLAMNTLEAVVGNIPDGVTLDSLNFTESRNSQGNNIILRGIKKKICAIKLLRRGHDAAQSSSGVNGEKIPHPETGARTLTV